ncbi:unnamed protein product [Orchesella dallaii]|uniref:F-box domain-containing protein n=1 Tax=Orchesella dallaii TaxID=48710 RepID=A0ABP1R4S9_9HEXA
MSNHLNDPSGSGKSILTSPNTHSYLPPEIWGQIFRSLSPRDLISIADACPEWNELLASEKKHALLELVLPLLNLSKSDILTCRTVSRGAKKMVDSQLQVFTEKQETFQFAHEESIRRRNFISKLHEIDESCNFRIGRTQRGRSAFQFLTRVGENLSRDSNPFLTRSILIPLGFDGVEYTAVERILTLFGHHVWSLSATIIGDDEDEDEDIENLPLIPTKRFARLLSLVPNLKSLSLSSDGWELIEALRPEELPELKHLVKLSFRYWLSESREPVPLAFLRRYGPQLVELQDASNYSLLQLDQLNVQVLNELLPNLKKLRLRRTFGSALPKLAKVNWRLEELTLACFYQWKIKDVFNIIGNFSETLVQLQLNTDFPRHVPVGIFGITGYPCKELSKLQVLQLDTDFADIERCSWFWNSVGTMCSHIREIHFGKDYIPYEPRILEVNAAKQVFVKLPNLERILYWEYNQEDGRNLSVHVLPLLNLNENDILTCREASRGAKKMVNNLLQVFTEEQESFQFGYEECDRRRRFNYKLQQINYSYKYATSFFTHGSQRRRTAQEFLVRMGRSLGRDYNPFLTRSIIISLNAEGDEYTAIEKLLTRFGHHVWSLTAHVDSDDEDEDDDNILNRPLIPTKKFARLLNLVPNLKSLTLSSYRVEPIEALSPEELPELKDLANLNFVRWANDVAVPFVFLRRYGRQLIEFWDACNDSLLQLDQLTVEVLNELLPNLKKLRLRRTFGSALPKLMHVNWRLEELKVQCFYKWTTKYLFDIISNFSQTLVQLQLNDYSEILLRDKSANDFGAAGYPCKALRKLEFLSFSLGFANINSYSWFWNSAPALCGHIREIHFERYVNELVGEPRTIEFHAAKDIFLKLPDLERILYWQVAWTSRELDIFVRSDYV